MSGHLVDTNVLSELTRERPDPQVVTFLSKLDKDGTFLSVMTIGEIAKGIAGLALSQRRTVLQGWLDRDLRSWFAGRILSVTEEVAELWGRLAANSKQRGTPLAVVDGLIAATALHHSHILVTRNVKDFEQAGVQVLNPFEAA